METFICKIDREKPDMLLIGQAGAILAGGGLVAFPTETVYGLGADAMDARASAKIYKAKGRPSDNPLIVHITEIDDLARVAAAVSEQAHLLARQFWPGPLTMILHKGPEVPRETTGGLDTVAVRMPSDPIARQVIKASNTFIAAPSANVSGKPSPTRAEHVIEDLNGRVDMIIDGGKVGIGLESTIVDLTGEVPVILRPGYITEDMIAGVLGSVEMDKGILCNSTLDFHPKAPGMKYKHYAPAGDLMIVRGPQAAVIARINRLVKEKQVMGLTTAVIAADETVACYKCEHVFGIGSRDSEESIASNLFDLLRQMDALDIDVIFSESFEGGGLSQAIMNRLLKAAGYQVLEVREKTDGY